MLYGYIMRGCLVAQKLNPPSFLSHFSVVFPSFLFPFLTTRSIYFRKFFHLTFSFFQYLNTSMDDFKKIHILMKGIYFYLAPLKKKK